MPTDAWLDAAEATISEGVREMCCRLNQGSTSFRRASANLARTAHLDISAETLRQVVEAEGQAVLRLFQQGELSPAAWRKAQPLPRLKTGADNAYKEFRIVHFYDQSLKRRFVQATRGNHEAAGRLMRRMGLQASPPIPRTRRPARANSGWTN